MAERGIEGFEELHRLFCETEHRYIPIPGRHRGKPVPYKEFMQHIEGRYPEVMAGLAEVFDLEPHDWQRSVLCGSYWRTLWRQQGAEHEA